MAAPVMEGHSAQMVQPPMNVFVAEPVSGATVQQAQGITVGQGNVIQAGRDVTVLETHYHGHLQTSADPSIIAALRHVPNIRRIHLDILSKVTPRTVLWFLETDKFTLWVDLNGNLKILWGTGIPGVGKSVMASVVVDALERLAAAAEGSICVAYIYFRYNDAANLTLRDVLEILVKQTVERHADCALLAQQSYAQHVRERTQPMEAELLQLLHRFVEATTATFYVLDALDEAPEKLQVVLVKRLASLSVRLFITSRPLNVVEARVPDVRSFSIIAQDSDLDLHITQEIESSRGLQSLLEVTEPTFKEEIVASIKENCGGMFLHASLQLDAVGWCNSTQEVLKTLAEFPSEIEDVYRQTWKRICSQTANNASLAKAVLLWVANASRSMTIEELRHAVSTSPDTFKFERKRMVSEATLITACCGLIVIEEETRLVRLVHYTVQASIQDRLHEICPRPHSLLATVCMIHLTECGMQNTTICSYATFSSVLHADPLLSYACDSWAEHVRRSLDDDVEIQQQTKAFISGIGAFPSFISTGGPEHFDVLSAMHILALHNIPFAVVARNGIGDPNVRTRNERASPLLLASWSGNGDMVRELLRLKETDVNATDKAQRSALMLAALQGREGIVSLLIEHPEIQVNLVDHKGWSALMIAANSGHESIVSLFLARHEIQINLIQSERWSALMMAAHQGHEGTLQLLLARPEIQTNLVDKEEWSALMMAAHEGHEGTVTLLLAHPKTQVNLATKDGASALMLSAFQGHERVVKLLLARPEIQVNLVDIARWSALMLAARQGHESTVKLLLAHSEIQISLVDNKGWSALMKAVRLGHENIVKLLMAHPEVQVNLTDHKGWSALMIAANRGYASIVQLFLERLDIGVNLVQNEGWSALMMAAHQGHYATVKLLLACPDIQVDLIDNEGWSALTLAEHQGHEDIALELEGRPLEGDEVVAKAVSPDDSESSFSDGQAFYDAEDTFD